MARCVLHIQRDETPKPEQPVQHPDILICYFLLKSEQKVVVKRLEFINLGQATATSLVDCI